MIFASVNLTVRVEDTLAACPYYAGTGKQTCQSGCWQEPSCITDKPSGGWESEVYTQHNKPNPILLAVRAGSHGVDEWHIAVMSTEIYGGYSAWDDESHPFHVLTTVNDDHLHHADRVLGRMRSIS